MKHAGLVVLALLAALPGCAGNAPNGSVREPAGPFHISNAKVKALVTTAINGADSSPGLAEPPEVDCTHASCWITYALKEPTGIDSDMELIQPTAGIWKALFSVRGFREGTIDVMGPTTSVGGKSGLDTLFSLSCDRSAADQIDWDNVDGHGLRTLCVYDPKVKGLPGSS